MKILSSSLVLLFAGFLVLTGSSQITQAAPNGVKIIKFEADWCGPCQQMKPIFNKVSENNDGVSFQTVNVDDQPGIADKYKIKLLPTVVAVKNGKEISRVTGFQNATKLQSFVKKASR